MAFPVAIPLSLPSVYHLTALKEIAEDYGLSAAAFGLILLFCVVLQFLIIEVPLVSYLIARDRTRQGVNDLNVWLGSHVRQICVAVAGVIGALQVLRGVADLVT